jgi:quinol monooxygenase YgiN
MIGRRAFVAAAAGAAILPTEVFAMTQDGEMHGLIGRLRANPGQRDALIAILLEGTADMPGCLSYIVARDATDANSIWVTEVWDSRESHTASLQLPSVREAIERARPLIASVDAGQRTIPVGGVGLVR